MRIERTYKHKHLAGAPYSTRRQKRYHNTYKKTFGHSTPDAPVEIINLRLVAIGLVDRVIDYSKINNQKTTKRVSIKKREVIFNNVKHLTNIINRNSIKLKDRLNGPLIIEEESALAMGNYTFENDSSKIKVEFSFGYKKINGLVKINLHHSSIPFQG